MTAQPGSRDGLRIGLMGVEPFLVAKLAGLRLEAELTTLHANDVVALRDASLDVVIVSGDHPGIDDVVRESGDIPVIVLSQPDELVAEGVIGVDRPVSSPRLQQALDQALGVGQIRRLGRSLMVEQDDHGALERYAFLARIVATLVSIGWIGFHLDVMPVWTLVLLVVYAVVRSLWWRLTFPGLVLDVAVVAPIAFVGILQFDSTPMIAVILPAIIWMQVAYQLRVWRGIAVLFGSTAIGSVLWWADSGFGIPELPPLPVEPAALALLSIMTGAMIGRVVRTGVPRRRQDLERFRGALYELSERQAVVALSFDVGTAAEEVLARVLRQTGANAAVILVGEPGSSLKIAAAHGLTKPAPTRLTWSPTTFQAEPGNAMLVEVTGVDAATPGGGASSRLPATAAVPPDPTHDDRVRSVASQLEGCLPAGRCLALPAVIDDELLGGIVLVEPHSQLASVDLQEVAVEAALAFDSVRLFNRLRAFTLDQERARIGRSLHDGVMQTLSHVGMQLDLAVNQGDVVADAESLRDLRGHVLATIAEMRAVVNDLRSVRLDRGLQAALETMAITVSPAGGPLITVHCDPAIGLAPDVEEQFLRITQEAVSNAVRHAEATKIGVSLHRNDGLVILRIADDGVGFTTSVKRGRDRDDSGGVGMTSIRQRADAIGARLDVDPGPGAIITVTHRPQRHLGDPDLSTG